MTNELENLKRLVEARAKATAGPWETHEVTSDDAVVSRGIRQVDGMGLNHGDDGYELFDVEDANFIALAGSTDLQAILAAMQQAAATIAEQDKKLAAMSLNDIDLSHAYQEQAKTIAEQAAIIDKLPKTKDGVAVYPGLHVWFRSPRHPDNDAEEMKVTGWDWLPRLGEGFMHAIEVVTETGEDDIVNLECCYSTREAALAHASKKGTT